MTMYLNKLYEERKEWLIERGRIKDPGRFEYMMDLYKFAYYTILEILEKRHWQNYEAVLYEVVFSSACFYEDSHRNNRALTLIIPAVSRNILKGFKIPHEVDIEDYIQGIKFFADYYNLEFREIKPSFETHSLMKTYKLILR